MSDTPRTDAEEFYPHDSQNKVCYASFCRQLERELNAANERIKRLEEFVEQLTNPKFTRDDLPKEALLQRIKRLEEAGDRMYWTLDAEETGSVGKEMWRKAKEAKP